MREKQLIKLIKKALQNDHKYSQDELFYMKKELKNLEGIVETNRKKISKGFGN